MESTPSYLTAVPSSDPIMDAPQAPVKSAVGMY